jgi:hypothetical protein
MTDDIFSCDAARWENDGMKVRLVRREWLDEIFRVIGGGVNASRREQRIEQKGFSICSSHRSISHHYSIN